MPVLYSALGILVFINVIATHMLLLNEHRLRERWLFGAAIWFVPVVGLFLAFRHSTSPLDAPYGSDVSEKLLSDNYLATSMDSNWSGPHGSHSSGSDFGGCDTGGADSGGSDAGGHG